MKTNFITIGAALFTAVVIFFSCDFNEEDISSPENAVLFSANINGAVQTRAANDAWSPGDEIGVYMVKSNTTDVVENALNKKYTTSAGNGNFSASTDDMIFYPKDGSQVDFVAYYPYRASLITLGSYNVDVSDQSDQEAIDLLYAKADNEGAGYDNSRISAVELEFRHQLSRLKLIVKTPAPELGISEDDLSNMTAEVSGLKTKAIFSLASATFREESTPTPIPLRMVTGGSLYDAIILPDDIADGVVEVTFTAGTQTFVWDISAITYESGKSYTYNVTLVKKGVATGVVASIVDWEISDDSDEWVIPPAELGTVVYNREELALAINNAKDGDYISLASDFQAWENGNPILITKKWETPITIQSADNANRALLKRTPFRIQEAQGVIFKNLDFDGTGYTDAKALQNTVGTRSSHIAIIGCKFVNMRETISVSYMSHLTIEYNDFLTTPEVGGQQNYVDFIRVFQTMDYLKIRKNRFIMNNTIFGDLATWHPDFIQFAISTPAGSYYQNNRGGECTLIEDNILYRPNFFTFIQNPAVPPGGVGNILHNSNANTQGIVVLHELLSAGQSSFEKACFRKMVIRRNDMINSMTNGVTAVGTHGLIVEGNRFRSTPGTPGTPGYNHFYSLDASFNKTYADSRPTLLLYNFSYVDSRIWCRNVTVNNNSAPRGIVGGAHSGGGQYNIDSYYTVTNWKIGENEKPDGWQDIRDAGPAFLPHDLDPWSWPVETLPAGWLDETPKDANGLWTVN